MQAAADYNAPWNTRHIISNQEHLFILIFFVCLVTSKVEMIVRKDLYCVIWYVLNREHTWLFCC